MILSPADALTALRDGNARYVDGTPQPWKATAELRAELARGQAPFACVITCSDSRVAPEILFDQSQGDLFVIRVAGTILTPEVVGSVEFAVEALNTKLVVVMAHSSCGAIEAAVSDLPLRGAISAVIARLGTIVIEKRKQGFSGDTLASEVSRQNTRNLAAQLPQQSPAILEALESGSVAISRAYFDVASGVVQWDF
ncbi:MAG: carbonic anhydrase [Calditrichaeota bacterium]|nr:carbonic anhydrase [Calditrichota bacterium]MCB9369445.1 carbonic anhydrase [Calditrichota bacterium]